MLCSVWGVADLALLIFLVADIGRALVEQNEIMLLVVELFEIGLRGACHGAWPPLAPPCVTTEGAVQPQCNHVSASPSLFPVP